MDFTTFKKLTRLEHSIFALPFVIAGALLPFITGQVDLSFQMKWLWVLPAFFAARFSGMAFNQAIDSEIDARNPRTKGRVVASGLLQKKSALSVAFAFLLLFLLCCSQLNVLTFVLSLMALVFLLLYSYTKRFTSFCHLVLGLIHFLAPIMAASALTGHLSIAPILLGGVSMMSIVGADILYALQDLTFDQEEGLHSIPAKYGAYKALKIARAAHLLSLLFLLSLGYTCHFSFTYYLSFLALGMIFFLFHFRVAKLLQGEKNLPRFEPFFGYATSSVSFIVLLFITLESL